MKKHISIGLIAIACAGLLLGATASVVLAKEHEHESDAAEETIAGSIRVSGELGKAERAALAKISFEDAMRAALARVPGRIVEAELEVEEGCLVYTFEIVGADKEVGEVMIDAGSGEVLDSDEV